MTLVTLLVASSAPAQDRISRFADQLSRSDDFRVRTQAALALGASKSKRAVSPLCSGLNDSNVSVRAAAAAALGKLSLGGARCLERRLALESSGSVRTTIKKALTTLGGEKPTITESTRVYVAIAKTTDQSGRSADGVGELVQSALRSAAQATDGFAVAPATETQAEAKKLLDRHRAVKGFYLAPKVMAPQYKNGNLVVRVEVAIFSYPDRVMRGNLPIKLTQQDVSAEDRAAEDELIKMAAERAIEKFAGNMDRLE